MKNFNGPFCEKLLVSVTKKAKKKKDRDPTISAVTNIHTRFYIQIREYPSTRILAAALPVGMLFFFEKLIHLDIRFCDIKHSLKRYEIC